MHRPARRLVVRHYPDQFAVAQILFHQRVGQHHDAHAVARCLVQTGGAVDQHRPADVDEDFTFRAAQTPAFFHRLPVIPSRVGEGQAIVLLQILWRVRHAAPRDVIRGSADRQGVVDQGPGDQVGLVEIAQAECDIEAVLQQIRTAVGQHHVELHLRIEQGVFAEGRGQSFNAEGQRRGDTQQAARLVRRLFGKAFGVGHQAEHFQAALIIDAAEFGQALAARGALQQLHAEPLLQRAQMIAHHRRRHFALRSGGRHAPGFDHFDVDAHRLKQIHYQARLLND